jgi:hypothetical protein
LVNVEFYPSSNTAIKPGMLMVRSISRDDLAQYFPEAKIITTPRGDYHYRVTLPASDVAKVVARSIEGISYDKVKPAVSADRADGYFAAWEIIMDVQSHSLSLHHSARLRELHQRFCVPSVSPARSAASLMF